MSELSKRQNFFIAKEFSLFLLIAVLAITLINGLDHGILVTLNTYLLLMLYRSSKTFAMFLYFIMSITMYVLPVLFHSYIDYFSLVEIGFDYNYIHALVYVFIFNTVFYISYHFFCKNVFNRPIDIFTKISVRHAILASLLFMFISLVASHYYLSYMGKTAGEHGTSTPFTEVATILTYLRVSSVALIGFYIVNHNTKNLIAFILYFSLLTLSISLALNSGSRFEVVILLIVVGFIHIETIKRHKFSFLLLLVILTPFIVVLFPVLMAYRNNTLGLVETFIGVLDSSIINNRLTEYSFSFHLGDIILDRMNLIGVIQRVIEIGSENSIYHFDYLQNITNNIPRVLWEGKSVAGINGNSLGHEFGILAASDNKTSITLTVIGESFYQLKYYGIVIAVFQGIIFSFFDKKIACVTAGAFILYLMLVINIVTIGSYVFVVSKIIMIFIVYLLVMFFTGLLKYRLNFTK